jgi:hypothetical protein
MVSAPSVVAVRSLAPPSTFDNIGAGIVLTSSLAMSAVGVLGETRTASPDRSSTPRLPSLDCCPVGIDAHHRGGGHIGAHLGG